MGAPQWKKGVWEKLKQKILKTEKRSCGVDKKREAWAPQKKAT